MAPIPSTMKAIQILETGGPEVMQYKDVPVPDLSANQVLIRNEYTGINFIDTYFRSGLYPSTLPLVLGREAAGQVVASKASGDVTIPVGARVVHFDEKAYAQYSVVNADKVIVIPDNLTTQKAAAVLTQGLTAWTFVREAANVQAGQWTLVHAAAGGTGLLLVQMLKSVGAKVIATASSQEKCDLASKNGAQWIINSSTQDVVAQVKEITGGHGVDVIFDGIGAATFDADLEMIAMKGQLISFGNASGVVAPLNILRLGPKNVKLMRPIVNGYIAERKDLDKYSSELFELVTSGKLNVAIHDIYPLSEAARAHIDIESRKTTGKLLLSCD